MTDTRSLVFDSSHVAKGLFFIARSIFRTCVMKVLYAARAPVMASRLCRRIHFWSDLKLGTGTTVRLTRKNESRPFSRAVARARRTWPEGLSGSNWSARIHMAWWVEAVVTSSSKRRQGGERGGKKEEEIKEEEEEKVRRKQGGKEKVD